ncbi:MAG: hypothetical protein ABI878_10410 [Acidobacteriota bacterium]
MTLQVSRISGLVILWALAAGLIVSAFAFSLQIDLWRERGSDWQGSFATVDYDEPFYAAYLQSVIDGKPRRNSPYTGVRDSIESPQKESYLSIQFLSFYPVAIIARVVGLSSSTAMIVLAPVVGFLSAIFLFFLIHPLIESSPGSFAITLLVLLCGGILAGQGGISSFVSPDTVHYSSSFLFLRRSVPAVSFPAFLLFFVFIWRMLASRDVVPKIAYAMSSVLLFGFTVYSYFYHWTIALGWFAVLVTLWAIFRWDDLATNRIYFAGVTTGFLIVLAPYVVMLLNRSTETDSSLILRFTHSPDFSRLPTIVGIAAAIIVIGLAAARIIDIRERSILFLLSFAFVPLVVFNQQVVTGRSLQPFHYQLFGANYIALLSVFGILLLLIKKYCAIQILNTVAVSVCVLALVIGFFDATYAAADLRAFNVWRDELFPVGKRIREMSMENKATIGGLAPVVLSLDLQQQFPIDSVELPAISSQPIVWEPHLPMFPDTDSNASLERLNTYLYYQDLDKEWVLTQLGGGNNLLVLGFFGGIRSNDPSINESERPTPSQVLEAADQYGKFASNFNYDMAAALPLSFVIVRPGQKNEDLSAVDRWYYRDAGEEVGKYVIYRVTLRSRQN